MIIPNEKIPRNERDPVPRLGRIRNRFHPGNIRVPGDPDPDRRMFMSDK